MHFYLNMILGMAEVGRTHSRPYVYMEYGRYADIENMPVYTGTTTVQRQCIYQPQPVDPRGEPKPHTIITTTYVTTASPDEVAIFTILYCPPFVRRARLLGLILAALFLLPACSGQGQPSSPIPAIVRQELNPHDNFIDGGNVQRTGVYNGGGGPRFGDVLWTYKDDYSNGHQAIVASGLALMGMDGLGLIAIDQKTGQLKFTLDTPAESYWSVPTVADGVLYYNGVSGLHAMDLATRKDKWVYSANAIALSPVVSDGVVYFGATFESDQVTRNRYLVAADAETGKEKWRFATGGEVSYPAIGDGMIYFDGGERQMLGFDYAKSHAMLHAVDLQSGKEVWHVDAPGTSDQPGSYGSPVYSDGMIYAVSYSDAGDGMAYLYTFDAKTGTKAWPVSNHAALREPKTPLVYDGTIYVSGSVPRSPGAPLYAFDAKTGNEKWIFKAGSYLGAPIISNGILYIAGGISGEDRGVLYSIDPQTGVALDKKEFDHKLANLGRSPVIADGTIYVQGERIEPQIEYVLIAVTTLQASPSVK